MKKTGLKKTGMMGRFLALALVGMLTVGPVVTPALGADNDTSDPSVEAVVDAYSDKISEEEQDATVEEAVEEIAEEAGLSGTETGSTAEGAIVEEYIVTLDANGGYFTNEWDDVQGETVEQAEIINKVIPAGGTVASLPVFNAEGVIASFLGWSLERDGELVATGDEGYAPVENCTLYAVWQIDEIETEASQESDDSSTADDSAAPDIKEIHSEESEEGGNKTVDDDHVGPGAEDDTAGAPADAPDNNAIVEDFPEAGAEEDTGKTAVEDPEEQKKYGADSVLEPSDPKEIDPPGRHDVSPDDDPSTDTAPASEEYEQSDDDVQDLPVAISDDAETETVTTDSSNSDAENFIRSGECGDNVIWVLTGTNPDTDPDLTLTISGTGDIMPGPSNYDWTLYNSVIGKVVIENGVTGIGPETFSGFQSLETITIPNTVTKIDNKAFYECSKLENITIPDGVTSIGDCAFYECSSLTSVTIPDSVTSIGEGAFRACRSLTSITIPDRVKSIETNTFYECRSLISVTLPDSLTSFGECIFERCSSLTSVTIPDGVTRIGDYTFYDCSSLSSVTIPDSVTSIGYKAFYSCSSLTSITIPDNVTSIGEWAFSWCESLTSVTIPDGVTSIGDSTFYNCSNLTNTNISENVTIIGPSAFCGCGITNVTIPDGVTSIGAKAFGYCGKLKSISIPESVTVIGSDAFINCHTLMSVTIPDGVTSIYSNTFYDCSSLTSVTIPDSVTSIGFQAFYKCSSLTNMTIPDNVDSIDKYAFYNCSSLTSVTIPGGVTSIGESAFSGCSSLTSLEISDSVNGIGKAAFSYCSSLTSVTIPGSVTSIGESAFQGCSSLTSLEISDSVNGIGKAAFSYCSSLTSVTIPDSVTTIGEDAFSGCTSLTKAVIPFSVTSIGKYAFYQRDSHFPSSNNPIENLTIYGYTGSYAEQYANENGIPFIAINGMSWIDDTGIPHYYTIALQATSTGCFITCDVGAKDDQGRYTKMDNPDLNADATEIKAYEEFELVPCSDGSYALRSVMNRKFLTIWRETDDENHYYIYYGFTEDFIGSNEKLILTRGSKGVIKTKDYDLWLYVKDGKLDVTPDVNKAEVFNQILVDDNSYTEEELRVLSQDEWFDLDCQDKGGFYHIQCDVGTYTKHNANTLRSLGYTLMNEGANFGRDYIEIDNMQCFVAYKKKTDGKYDVIIDFQGTGGYDDEDTRQDVISNLTGDIVTSVFGGSTYSNEYGLHKGYYDMANKLIVNESNITDYANTENLTKLISKAKNGEAHFTLLGHSMGGAIAQCYALHLVEKGIPKDNISGRTFNSALAVDRDKIIIRVDRDNYIEDVVIDNDKNNFKDWYNICVSSDSVCNGLVTGSIIYYGIHRLGKTIWLYDRQPDKDNETWSLSLDIGENVKELATFLANIAEKKHNMNACLYRLLYTIWEFKRCDHSWGAGNTTAVATLEEEGELTYTCSKCGKTKTETLPAFGSFKVTGLKAKNYTGKAITQTPVLKNGDKILEAGTDYLLSYQNNINAGTATVTITGKGNYSGTITKTFKINKAAQTITTKAAASSIAVGKTTTVSITGAKGTKSFKSSDISIATVDKSTGKLTAKKVGTVKITATSAATSNFNAASKTVTVKVVPAATASLTAANQATGIKLTWKKVTGATGFLVYRGSSKIATIKSGSTVTCTDSKANTNGTKYTYKIIATASTGNGPAKSVTTYCVARPAISSVTNSASKKMTVKWGKNAKASGYQIHYCTDKTFKSGNKSVSITSASTVSKVIGSLTKNKTYYIRIRTYKTVGSTKYFSSWSPVKSVKISK